MSFLTLARVLFVFLAFQLAVGLQPTVATAAAAQSAHSSGEACPTHGSAPDPSTPKHDCCKSSGCQSYCGSLPVLINLPIARVPPAESALTRPASATRAPSAPTDPHFRPPIAA